MARTCWGRHRRWQRRRGHGRRACWGGSRARARRPSGGTWTPEAFWPPSCWSSSSSTYLSAVSLREREVWRPPGHWEMDHLMNWYEGINRVRASQPCNLLVQYKLMVEIKKKIIKWFQNGGNRIRVSQTKGNTNPQLLLPFWFFFLHLFCKLNCYILTVNSTILSLSGSSATLSPFYKLGECIRVYMNVHLHKIDKFLKTFFIGRISNIYAHTNS